MQSQDYRIEIGGGAQIGKKIEVAEEQVTQLQNKVEDPKIASMANALQEACKELQQAQQNLEVLYQRWQELENKLTP